MKILTTLLFLTTLCFAQNKPKLTAYRLVNPHDDGPCSIKYYVDNEEFFLAYVSAESTDKQLIDKLLTIKKQAKKWKKKSHFCSTRMRGGDLTTGMFVIESGAGNDTILTTYDYGALVFPGKEIAYIDKEHVLYKALTGNVKEFFEYDFNNQIRSWFTIKGDSINHDRVTYKGKSIYGLTEELFKKQYTNKRLEDERSYHVYLHDANTYLFSDNRLKEVTIETPNSNWVIDGVQTGDNESILLTRYPNSAKAQLFNDVRFEDIKRKYHYSIILKGSKGSIDFYIEDKIIEKIVVSFYYR
jgi:hypothetical protein